MGELAVFAQLMFAVIAGVYFFMRIKSDSNTEKVFKKEYANEAEELNKLRRISLDVPLSEMSRPQIVSDIIGQEEGMRALRAALWGKHPQHVIIYGPPGVGKTAAARIIMEEVKKSPMTPFTQSSPFIEADATIMRCDEHGFADPLIGSVHDPIYQGSGAFGQNGIPQPKPGAVTKAHGGILFLDEIGELETQQMNKLLKVLEDRRVMLESSYYSSANKKIPAYIRDIFENGLPADFRLIGATTAKPEQIPEAIRSRCTEIYFDELRRSDILEIVRLTAARCGVAAEAGVKEMIADYAQNGREAVKILQSSRNLAKAEGRGAVELSDVSWIIHAGRYKKRCEPYLRENEKIIDISMIKPHG